MNEAQAKRRIAEIRAEKDGLKIIDYDTYAHAILKTYAMVVAVVILALLWVILQG